MPAITSNGLDVKLKPTSRPTATITTNDTVFVATSASVRPARTAERAIGRERKRSTSPLLRSSERHVSHCTHRR
jgi:hypothetical protein